MKTSFQQKIYRSLITAAVAAVFLVSFFFLLYSNLSLHRKKYLEIENELTIMAGLIENRFNSMDLILDNFLQEESLQDILSKKKFGTYQERFNATQKIYIMMNSIEIKTRDIPLYIMSTENPILRISNQENFESIYSDKSGYGFNKIVSSKEDEKGRIYYVHRRVDGKEPKDIVLTVVQKIMNYESKETVGYVFLDVYKEYFDEIFSLRLEEEAKISVLYDGEVISDSRGDYFLKDESILNDKGLRRKGLNLIMNYPIDRNIHLVQELHLFHFYKENLVLLLLTSIFFIAFTFLAKSYSRRMSKRLLEPVHDLSMAMKMVEEGSLDSYVAPQNLEEFAILSDGFNSMLTSLNDLIDQVYKKQLLLQETEIKLLKSQINPHFINNTLESVKWLIRKDEKEKAQKTLQGLGRILSQKFNDQEFHTLKNDLEFIEYYLEIQALRFADRFKSHIIVSDDLLELMIPSFLIQPLIENALIHGLDNKLKGAELWLFVFTEDDELIVSVYDNGDDFSDKDFEKGFALNNIDQRLQLYYGSTYQVEVKREKNLTVQRFRIPLKEDKT